MTVFDTAFPIFEVIGIFACLIASGFFSGSETALTSIPENRAHHLLESEPQRYAILKFWLDNKQRILSTLLVGNNLVNILCSVLAYRVALFALSDYGEAIAEATAVFGLTLIILIFSEITPKSLALRYYESVMVPILRLVWVIDKMFWLVSSPLSKIPRLIVPGDKGTIGGPVVTEDEIEYQIRLGHDKEVFEDEEHGELLISAIEFAETSVKEAMVPRTDMFSLEATTNIDDAVEAIVEQGHSRVPIYRGNVDEIVGLLYAKDLITYLKDHHKHDTTIESHALKRPPLFAPETQKVSDLLSKMRASGQHMAIVVDEFGGTAGLITLEDILEEIVGEIRDEFDSDETMVRQIDNENWQVDARMTIHDLKDNTGIELLDTGDYESVGGFVIAHHGSIPTKGVVIESNGVRVTVLSSNERRVEKLNISIIPPPESANNA